jgi:probable phosphoglycerate mutase
MRLLLTRHGETLENKRYIVQGWNGGNLSPLGRRQARLLAERLKSVDIDMIFTSDLSRATDTARIISKYHKDTSFIESKLLRERNYGALQGKSSKNLDWDRIDQDLHKVPKMEKLVHLRSRAEKFYKMILKKYPDKTVLVVSHGCILTILLGVIQGKPLMESVKVTDSKNASMTEFIIDKKGNYRIIHMHCTKHLDRSG